jgi:hypothetical protein
MPSDVSTMTCPLNAIQTGVAATRLEPGESFNGSWGIPPH